MTNTSYGAQSRHPGLVRYLQSLKYALHVIVRPFDGFWDLSREKRGSLAAANTIILLALITRVLKLQYTSFQFIVVHWETVNVLREMLSLFLPLLIWCCANWCWTTLFDGKGSFKDVYMGMGYALTEDFPLENGVPKAKFGTLGLLRAPQIPEIHAIYVEKEELLPVAYGAKGIGEIAAIPTAPAVQGAYYARDGIFRTKLPLEKTPYRK